MQSCTLALEQRADGQVDLESVQVLSVKGKAAGLQSCTDGEDEEAHTGLLSSSQWQVGVLCCASETYFQINTLQECKNSQ